MHATRKMRARCFVERLPQSLVLPVALYPKSPQEFRIWRRASCPGLGARMAQDHGGCLARAIRGLPERGAVV